jgi:dsRNA-specific ribonuclease
MISSDTLKGEFMMAVCMPDGSILGTGTATSKKQAEQNACQMALQAWGLI